jgi:hypothetical protein
MMKLRIADSVLQIEKRKCCFDNLESTIANPQFDGRHEERKQGSRNEASAS